MGTPFRPTADEDAAFARWMCRMVGLPETSKAMIYNGAWVFEVDELPEVTDGTSD